MHIPTSVFISFYLYKFGGCAEVSEYVCVFVCKRITLYINIKYVETHRLSIFAVYLAVAPCRLCFFSAYMAWGMERWWLVFECKGVVVTALHNPKSTEIHFAHTSKHTHSSPNKTPATSSIRENSVFIDIVFRPYYGRRSAFCHLPNSVRIRN